MSESVAPKRRVVVFGLGGTIAMAAQQDGGVVPSVTAAQLVEAVPGLAQSGVDLDVVEFRKLPGASLSFADIAALSDAIDAQLAAGADGIVVTQGTDTLEETAYLLDLWHRGAQPVVMTGAMRNPTQAGADGPANLLAAVQLAASPTARGLGVLVIFADEIHAARRVRKVHSTSIAAFQSPNGGPLGLVVEGAPRLLSHLPSRTPVPRSIATTAPRVALVTVALSDDGLLLESLANRAQGAVIAAFGVGHVPQQLVPALAELASRMPVVLASRTGAGASLAQTYGFPGSESDLLGRGLIRAGFLDPYKARLLLQALLAAKADREQIMAAFGAAGGYAEPSQWPWPHPSQP